MTIEIYTHDKDDPKDFIRVIDLGLNEVQIRQLEYNSIDELKNLMQSIHHDQELGTLPNDKNSGMLIDCHFVHDGRINSILIFRGMIILRENGIEFKKVSNF
jgi:hypothetical protein